ncbi:MAG: HTH domain-containing protein, partial [Cyanobacteria bacterium P01_E01_bin.34]
MRRADRLLQILLILRAQSVVTARQLAERLEVSERTIYRDVQELIFSGIPIEAEAGTGYCLPDSFDLPPIMFTTEELRALVLGVRTVQSWGDRDLAQAASVVLDKVNAILPERLRDDFESIPLFVPAFHVSKTVK